MAKRITVRRVVGKALYIMDSDGDYWRRDLVGTYWLTNSVGNSRARMTAPGDGMTFEEIARVYGGADYIAAADIPEGFPREELSGQEPPI